MHIHKEQNFTIYFGNALNSTISIQDVRIARATQATLTHQQVLLNNLATINGAVTNNAIFLHQTHGINGNVITSVNAPYINLFNTQGDYLITATPGIPLGVLTADCLPIVFFDPVHNIAALAHAGWRGSLAGIATETVAHMQKEFGTKSTTLKIFLGPCAKVCCYEVSHDFGKSTHKPTFLQQSLIIRSGQHYFDNVCYTIQTLKEYGIQETNINTLYNNCTLCTPGYCSYRKDKEQSKLQATIIVLH